MALELNVNGEIHQVDVDPDTPLLYVLRNDLGLKGAKFTCGLGQCGTCNIIIDNRAVPSCRIAAGSVQGREIVTIEGLGTPEELHPLQEAFVEEQAVQCGLCVPGIIMTAKALLDRNPHPTDDDIRKGMGVNLCRCGIYDRVLRAIRRAAGETTGLSADHQTVSTAPLSSSDPRRTPLTDARSGSLERTPDMDDWIRINPDATITILTGKVELGQDIRTSLAMIASEELDVSLDRVRVVTEDTGVTPNEGFTGSSISLETSGNAIRNAAAEARQVLVSLAAEKMQTPRERLTVSDGTVTDNVSGQSVTYWGLLAGKRFDRKVQGGRPLKTPAAYQTVGRSAKRLDLVEKVTGRYCFVHDMDLPGMVHGRVVRPPVDGAELVSVDTAPVEKMPGIIEVFRDGSFLAVLAERKESAVKGRKVLEKSATWEAKDIVPTPESLHDYMLGQQDQPFLVVKGTPNDDPIPPIQAPPDATDTLRATYTRPYHMHASIAPPAAVGQFVDGKLTVWSHTQGAYGLRSELSKVLELPREDIHVTHVDGAGSFGHNGANDAAFDAALLARALPGRPVSVKWSREDENRFEPYGPATVVKMQASLNGTREIVDWNHDVYGYSHVTLSGVSKDNSSLLGSWSLSQPRQRPRSLPIKAYHVGIHRNADPLYAFPKRRIVKHFLPDSPFRTAALRGLGTYANVFAIESFMDELAHGADIDPVELRLRYLVDKRARSVLEAVLEKGGWRAGEDMDTGDGRGWGVALSQYKNLQCYTATFVVLTVDEDAGRVILEKAVLAADVGQIVNPESVSSQLEGTFTQAASWTLKEQVTFDTHGITSVDWRSYPIFRFADTPTIETVLIDRPGAPYLGLGEGASGPVPAAIANGIFRAAGIRMRQVPFSPERIKAALAARFPA